MSFIGPRPLLIQYLPLYSAEQRRRHDVTPGISGLAQVKGRNSISWTEKFEFDVYYVDKFSLWLDLKISFTKETGFNWYNKHAMDNTITEHSPLYNDLNRLATDSYDFFCGQ